MYGLDFGLWYRLFIVIVKCQNDRFSTIFCFALKGNVNAFIQMQLICSCGTFVSTFQSIKSCRHYCALTHLCPFLKGTIQTIRFCSYFDRFSSCSFYHSTVYTMSEWWKINFHQTQKICKLNLIKRRQMQMKYIRIFIVTNSKPHPFAYLGLTSYIYHC